MSDLTAQTSQISSQPSSLEQLFKAFYGYISNPADLQQLFTSSLQTFAQSPDFSSKMSLAFGEGNDYTQWQNTFASGQFSAFPAIEIRSGSELNGANAAYAGSTNTIYFSSDFLSQYSKNLSVVNAVLLEEFGHAVDWQTNAIDSPGDEGAIFAYLLGNEYVLDSIFIEQLKHKQDNLSISIQERMYNVEANESIYKLDFNPIIDAVTKGIDNLEISLINAIENSTIPFVDKKFDKQRIITEISNLKNKVISKIQSSNIAKEFASADLYADNVITPYELAYYLAKNNIFKATSPNPLDPNANRIILGIELRDFVGSPLELPAISTALNGDVGIPGLSLSFDVVEPTLNLKLDFGFGLGFTNRDKVPVSKVSEEIYINPRSGNKDEIILTLDAQVSKLDATGELGFIQLNAKKAAGNTGLKGQLFIDWEDYNNNNQINAGEVSVELDPLIEANLALTSSFDKLTQSLNIPDFLPQIKADMKFSLDPDRFDVWPNFRFDRLDGKSVNDNVSITLEFNKVAINAAGIISEFAAPLVKRIQQITAPLNPFIEALNKDITLLEDLKALTGISFDIDGNGEIDSFDLIKAFYPQVNTVLFQNFSKLVELVNDFSIPDLEGINLDEYLIELGDFQVVGAKFTDGKLDLSDVSVQFNPDFDFYAELDQALQGLEDKVKAQRDGATSGSQQTIDVPAQPIEGASNNTPEKSSFKYGTWLKQLGSLPGGGIKFPFLDNPIQSIVDLFAGNTFDLMTYDMPEFYASFALDQEFPVMTGVDLSLGGGITASANFDFGFDTYGLQKLAAVEDKLSNAYLILDGFYVADPSNGDKEIPEVTISGEIRAGGEVGIGIGGFDLASAGITGGIEASLWADLVDPNKDGKVRGSELWSTLTTDPLGLFDIGGTFTAGAEVYAEYWNPFKFKQVRETLWKSDRITLYQFDTSSMPRDRQPDLATLENSNLRLNIGTRANQRGAIFNEDRYEEVTIKGTRTSRSIATNSLRSFSAFSTFNTFATASQLSSTPTNSVSVSAFGFTQTYAGFNTIIANGGQGNTIIQMLDTNASLDFYGGEGDDIIQGASGNDTIRGGEGWNFIFGGDGADSINGGSKSDKLYGEDGNDQVFGGSGSDVLFGGFGNDSISGGNDDDHVNGDDGDDVIQGGSGDDVIFGDTGNDVVAGEQGTDNIQGNLGDDTLSGGDDGDFIEGNEGDDRISGDAGSDIISGGGDNDLISGGGDNDLISGDAGEDTITGDGGDDSISGGDDNDSIQGNEGNDSITGDNGNDTIEGNDGLDTISGGNDNDTISGGEQNDTITGDAGDDSITGDGGNDNIQGNTGNDNIQGNSGDDLISGGDDQDTIQGNEGNDSIYGDNGNDTIEGNSGSDLIYGGEGNDTISGNEDNDLIYGDGGDDRITGDGGDDQISGGEGNDTIAGNDGLDKIKGDAGNDVITGDAGNDTIEGGTGNDTIQGNLGDDLISGGDNDDVIQGNEGNDSIFGDGGKDTIEGNSGADTISGGDGDDVIAGNEDSDRIYGDGGNDRITGDGGEDLISGGEGNDTIQGNDGNDRIYGDGGNDSIQGNDGDDLISGGDGNDSITGDAGNDLIQGDAGDDTIAGNEDNDTISGGTGNDAITGDAGEDLLHGNDGNDTIAGNDGNDLIYGDAGDDSLQGNAGDDRLYGGDGNDFMSGGDGKDLLYGEGGNDFMEGNAGEDSLAGGDGNDFINGGTDNDFINGQVGDDVLYGDAGNDSLYGEDGEDSLYGGDGEDYLVGGAGGDYIDGGNGSDFLSYYTSPEGVLVQLSSGNNRFGDAQRDSIRNVEDLEGSFFDDTLIGDNEANRLIGLSGDDFLDGKAGADSLYGGLGNDTLDGREGNDLLDGGEGDDYLDGRADDDSLAGGAGNDTLLGGQSGDDLLSGGDGNDYIEGSSGTDTIYGGMGDDTIDGGSHDDLLSGGEGNDLIQAGSGDDLIEGGDGNDTIDGHTGNDSLMGGAGDDVLRDESGDNLFFGGLGNDIIYGGNGQGTDTFVLAYDFGFDTIYNFQSSRDILGVAGTLKIEDLKFTAGAGIYANDTLVHSISRNELLAILKDLRLKRNETPTIAAFPFSSLPLPIQADPLAVITQPLPPPVLGGSEIYPGPFEPAPPQPVVSVPGMIAPPTNPDAIQFDLAIGTSPGSTVPSGTTTNPQTADPSTTTGSTTQNSTATASENPQRSSSTSSSPIANTNTTPTSTQPGTGTTTNPSQEAQENATTNPATPEGPGETPSDDSDAETTVGTPPIGQTGADSNESEPFSPIAGTPSVQNSPKSNHSADLTPPVKGETVGLPINRSGNLGVAFNSGLEPTSGLKTALIHNPNNTFSLRGPLGQAQLRFTLDRPGAITVDEIGITRVDDAQGSINGIAPGATGYLEAVLSRSQVIFSVLTQPVLENQPLTRHLELETGSYFQVYLVQNSTSDVLKAGRSGQVFFGTPVGNSDRIPSLEAVGTGESQFKLNWRTSGNQATTLDDIGLIMSTSSDATPIGANLQGQVELLDLQSQTGQVTARFEVQRDADFENTVGFYVVENQQGQVRDLFGNLLNPGDAGYAQAAIQQRVSGVELKANNHSTAVIDRQLNGGVLLAPFIIANGTVDQFLDSVPMNDPAIYFPYLGANPGQTDHIRLLADNTFGFEDLPMGGDQDYNDIVVRVNFI